MREGWWWKWPMLGLATVVAGVGVVVAIGAALPVAHEATASVRLDAPPERVWSLISDVERFPEWRPGVTEVRLLEPRDGRPIWREETSTGALTMAVDDWDPPRRLVARIADEDLPFGGSWTYEVTPDGDGARLTITEAGEVYHPVFRFVSRFVFGHDATIRDYLAGVEAELGTVP